MKTFHDFFNKFPYVPKTYAIQYTDRLLKLLESPSLPDNIVKQILAILDCFGNDKIYCITGFGHFILAINSWENKYLNKGDNYEK